MTKIRPSAIPVCLARAEAVSLAEARRVLIRCRRGRLWITQDGDPRDIVLDAGECFRPDRDSPVIVSAMCDSSVEVLPAGPESGWVQAVLQRLHSFVGGGAGRSVA